MQSISGLWHEQWTDNTLRKALNSSNGLCFVYGTGDGIQGFIFAYDFGFRAYIAEIAVVEKRRFYGIGKELLKHVENTLRERNCELIIADVWKIAEQFYRGQGWVEPSSLLLKKLL